MTGLNSFKSLKLKAQSVKLLQIQATGNLVGSFSIISQFGSLTLCALRFQLLSIFACDAGRNNK
jgi:hypothetical protein